MTWDEAVLMKGSPGLGTEKLLCHDGIELYEVF